MKEIDVLLSELPAGNQSSKLDSTVKELLSNLVDGGEGEDLCLNSQMRREGKVEIQKKTFIAFEA